MRRLRWPWVARKDPRPRAAFPLAQAERLPVSLPKNSRTRPAIRSTAPLKVCSRADLMIAILRTPLVVIERTRGGGRAAAGRDGRHERAISAPRRVHAGRPT